MVLHRQIWRRVKKPLHILSVILGLALIFVHPSVSYIRKKEAQRKYIEMLKFCDPEYSYAPGETPQIYYCPSYEDDSRISNTL